MNNQTPPPIPTSEPTPTQNLNQNPEPPKENSNKNKIILGILIFAIIAIFSITGVLAGYTIFQRQIPNSSNIENEAIGTQANENLTNIRTEEQASPTPSETPYPISNWNTYENKIFDFQIKYPKLLDGDENEWTYDELDQEFGNLFHVGFGPPESKQGGNAWTINIYSDNLESLISDIGDQFDDRKEQRENININGQNAILTTVTTDRSPTWIAKTVIMEKDGNIYAISNGAIDNPEFENFYKSFAFTN